MSLFVGGPLGDTQRANIRCATQNSNSWRCHIAIGASGAATVSTTTDAAGGVVTFVKNTTGVYDVTFPVLAAVGTSVPTIRAWVMTSAATTVAGTFVKAFAPTSGTAQVITYLNTAGTPVEPANGDVIGLELVAASTVA